MNTDEHGYRETRSVRRYAVAPQLVLAVHWSLLRPPHIRVDPRSSVVVLAPSLEPLRGEARLAQQGDGVGLAAAEVAEGLQRRARAAALEEGVEEAFTG